MQLGITIPKIFTFYKYSIFEEKKIGDKFNRFKKILQNLTYHLQS